jgi:hypothetical protein
LEKILEMSDEELSDYESRARALTLHNDTLSYSLPGLPLCWKCTVKHVGQAMGFAAELDKYPERIVCVVGELGHAYRECPDKKVAELLHETYQKILDTGCVPDLTDVLSAVSSGWRNHLQDSK